MLVSLTSTRTSTVLRIIGVACTVGIHGYRAHKFPVYISVFWTMAAFVRPCAIPARRFDATCVPTVLTSYPGSGNTLTRRLIEALTGVWTGSVYGDTSLLRAGFKGELSRASVVAVKTHHPFVDSKHDKEQLLGRRVILLLRNPARSIPSWHNYCHFLHLHNGHPNAKQHQIQAPESKWDRYRDAHFEEQLDQWLRHLRFWQQRCPRSHRFVVTYEALVDPVLGPMAARQLHQFLNRSGPGNASAGCLWKAVIAPEQASSAIHRAHVYEPKLRRSQLTCLEHRMRSTARQLARQEEHVLATILNGYASAAESNRVSFVGSNETGASVSCLTTPTIYGL